MEFKTTRHTMAAFMTLPSGEKRARFVAGKNILEVCRSLTVMIEDLRDTPTCVTLHEAYTRITVPRSLYFSNICGKIQHKYSYTKKLRNAVEPFIVSTKNAFGSSMSVYSPLCNLLLNNGGQTLFRGAASTEDVLAVVGHALDMNSVVAMYLHMIVANARLGRPVPMECRTLCDAMTKDPRWSAIQVVQPEDESHVVCFKVKDFDATWLSALLPKVEAYPTALLVNVSCHGSVSLFLTVGSGMQLTRGAEEDVRPLFAVFERVLLENT